jgi:hypothetical protein
MIDPELGLKAIREYHENTPLEQQIEDLRRWSPKLAERLGLNDPEMLKRLEERNETLPSSVCPDADHE